MSMLASQSVRVPRLRSNHALQRTGLGFLASDRLCLFMVYFPFLTLAHSTARSLSLIVRGCVRGHGGLPADGRLLAPDSAVK